MKYQIIFEGWNNPQNDDITGYHVGYYADAAGVDFPGVYKSKKEAEKAAQKMTDFPDEYGISPKLTVSEI